MSSAFESVVVVITIALSSLAFGESKALWVCADGNNLPFSNRQEQGFENKLAQMVAQDLGRPLRYIWWPASPTFARRVFRNGACDMMMGIPASHYDLADATQPYYTSTYVFVTKLDRHLAIRSFDDPSLRTIRVGLHVIDDGYTPAAQELAARGIIRNVVGYNIFGNLATPNPSADLIRAVVAGDVDVAVAWGPLAGYFAQRSSVPLKLTEICRAKVAAGAPVTFSIAMGVRHGEPELRDQLNAEISRRHDEIRRLLLSYGVPLVSPAAEARLCQ